MKKWLSAIVFVMCFMAGNRLLAQGCAVCTKTASELDKHSARGLNGGILYLAFLPLAILGTVGFAWWWQGRAKA